MSRRKNQRGFVLVTALTLSVLYFALMELLLIDSSRALGEAQRFRSHVICETLAENAAELAAFQLITKSAASVNATNFQGTMHGELQRNSNSFVLNGKGSSIGVMPQSSSVRVEGRIDESGGVKIDFTVHEQQ
jgi:Tfp pilus assembly protein PilX